MKRQIIKLIALFTFLVGAGAAFAQTSAFTYQGKINNDGAPVSGAYQFQFKLYDAASGGVQIGQTLADVPATVTNGVFAVSLDFGAASFDGAARWLEVGVRENGSPAEYTLLNPRHAVASVPYAVKSLNANQANTAETANTATNSTNLGGVPATQFVQTADTRLSDAREPLAGSVNYVQNTQNPQASSNFNISGTGKANKFNATTQYDINGVRVLSVTGANNAFVGVNTGTAGSFNAFVGFEAGKNNINGSNNAFFGANAGRSNSLGSSNAYFGANAGFAGFNVGSTFVGFGAGSATTNGANNTAVGFQSSVGNNLTNATAIGANAVATQSNSVVLGTAATYVQIPGTFGVSKNAVFSQDVMVSNSIIAPKINIFGGLLKIDPTNANEKVTFSDAVLMSNTLKIDKPGLGDALTVSGGAYVSGDIVAGKSIISRRFLSAKKLTSGHESNPVCVKLSTLDDHWTLSECSSSIRYKENVQNYRGGLDLIQRLRPVTFDWKADGKADLGFIAEEVNELESRFTILNEENLVSGVKYQLITVSLVSAMQEQQTQIKQQQQEIAELKAIVCSVAKDAAVCQK